MGHRVRRRLPDLAILVGPPGPDGTVRLEGEGVISAGGHCHITALPHVLDRDRHGVVNRITVTQLPLVVLPPGPEGAIRLQGEGACTSGGDGFPAAGSDL